MFEILITYLKELLETSKIAEKVTYAERKNKYSKEGQIENIVPMEPSGNAYLPINWDEFNGVIYIRENGRIRSSDSPAKAKACAREYQYSIPLKIVAGITKDKECFLAHNMAEKIISVISGKNGTLKESLNAKSVIIKTQSYITDSEFIQSEEYKVNPRFGYDLTLVSLDILVEVYSSHNLSCFQPPCPEVSRPVPEPECTFLLEFNDEQEAIDKGWVTGGVGVVSGGAFCTEPGAVSELFGLIYADYQDAVEYTVSFDITGWTPTGGGDGELQIDIFGAAPLVVITEGVGSYSYTRTGNTGSPIIAFETLSTDVCIDNICII